VEQLVARWAHNPKATGSSPVPATKTESQSKDWLFSLTKLFCNNEYVLCVHYFSSDKNLMAKPMNDIGKTREELIEELRRLRQENIQLKSLYEIHDNEKVLAQNKFRMLFEQSPVGMALVLHETGAFLEVNNSVLESTGYTIEEFLSLSYWDLTPREYEQQEIDQLETLNRTGYFGPNFKEYIRKDGTRYPLSISGALFVDVDGRKVVWGIIEDLTDRRESELIIKNQNEELLLLNAAKDKFFSIIAHDLKNPFSAIIGSSDLLLSRAEKNDIREIDKYAKIINQSSKKALDLLLNLMDWSQIQTGHMNYVPEYFDINILVEEALELLGCNAEEKSISIRNNISKGTMAYADKIMISIVLRNLISNAIKYTNQNGLVTLSAEQQKNELILSVKDNGVGIAQKNLDKLFKIDGVYSTPGTQQEKGTGLGLILCKEYIEKNKGGIWIESVLKAGTNFYFSLPLNN
jgi:two-component system sensor histidine kinase/response regulator